MVRLDKNGELKKLLWTCVGYCLDIVQYCAFPPVNSVLLVIFTEVQFWLLATFVIVNIDNSLFHTRFQHPNNPIAVYMKHWTPLFIFFWISCNTYLYICVHACSRHVPPLSTMLRACKNICCILLTN